LAGIEQRKRLLAPWTISARRFTSAENKALWNTYDWSSRGEEWTKSSEWKAAMVRDVLMPNIPAGGVTVEIGPGGGRWTEVLQTRSTTLFVVDVSETALNVCRNRFGHCSNIEYLLTNGREIDLPDGCVDAIWSYDVFVHVNPLDAREYFREFARILRPGGRAVIHHPGTPAVPGQRRRGWRSDLTDTMISDFVAENGLRVVSRTAETKNPGDYLSVIEK
jgi:ubiquinone/menaquinone biosynthesis C-methylase UbiE